jgi:outer membrane protein assembly factor BamB
VRPFPDPRQAGEPDPWGEMGVRPDPAVVLHDRTRVHDRVLSELGAGVHDRPRECLDSPTQRRPGRNNRGGVEDRGELEPFREQTLEGRAPRCAIADAAHSDERMGRLLAQLRKRGSRSDARSEELGPRLRRVVVNDRDDLVHVCRTDRLEDGLRVGARTEADDSQAFPGGHAPIIGRHLWRGRYPERSGLTMNRRVVHPPALLAVLALGIAACSDTPQETKPPAPAGSVPTMETPAPAPLVRVSVRDGDTSKPVPRATVRVAGVAVPVDDSGVAELAPRDEATLRVAAPGYGERTVHVSFRRRVVQRVELWRPRSQWPIYGAVPARTQAHPNISLRPPFRVVWRRNLRSNIEFPAVVWNGVAYVSDMSGRLQALSMENGRVLWHRRSGYRTASSPGIDAKRGVLVTTSMSPGDVKIMSMKTGRILWRSSIGRAEPSPVIRGGVAYFGAANGNVYALDLDKRRMRWVFHGGAKITGSPSLVGNRLYVGDYAGRVFALDIRNGRRLWTGSAGSRVYGSVAAAGGRLFVPSVFSGLSALSARSGRLLWRIPVGAYLYSSPAVYRGRVYFGAYTGSVYAASVSSGRILWASSAGGSVSGAIEVVGGNVYAGSFAGAVTAWHWRSGRKVWTFSDGRYVPVSGNGARLLIHGHRTIYAVVPKRRR